MRLNTFSAVLFGCFSATVVCQPPQQNNSLYSLFSVFTRYFQMIRGNTFPVRNQFGFLYLSHETGNVGYNFPDPRPPLPSDTTYHADVTPEDFGSLNNYLFAFPYSAENPNRVAHVEETLTNNAVNLLEAYGDANGVNARQAVLYTRYSPCQECINIIQRFHRYVCMPNDIDLIVIASEQYDPRHEQAIQPPSLDVISELFQRIGIIFFVVPWEMLRQCRASSSGSIQKRSVNQTSEIACMNETFQGCLLNKLQNLDVPCLAQTWRKVAFVNTFTARCWPDYTQPCSFTLIDSMYTGRCARSLKMYFSGYVVECSSKLLSNPLNEEHPGTFPGIMVCPGCLQEDLNSPGCLQTSQDCTAASLGGLCKTTSRGATCRPDSHCGFHGQNYSWCYTDTNGNKDYCCMGPCKGTGNQKTCDVGRGTLSSGDAPRTTTPRPRVTEETPSGPRGGGFVDYVMTALAGIIPALLFLFR